MRVEGLPSTEALLAEQGVTPIAPGDAALELAIIACMLYAVAFCALVAKAPRFQTLPARCDLLPVHHAEEHGSAYATTKARAAKSPARRRTAKEN